MNDSNSKAVEKTYNQRFLVGLVILVFVFILAVGFGLVSVIKRDRQQAQYPGSVPISAHSNYKSLPRSYRWDDAFRTDDGFRSVYEWYSLKFNLSCYLKNMTEAHGQNKQADLEFKTNACHCMNTLGQYSLNQAARRFYHFAM